MGYLTIILAFIVYKTSRENTADSLSNLKILAQPRTQRDLRGIGSRRIGGNPAVSIKRSGDRDEACYAGKEWRSLWWMDHGDV